MSASILIVEDEQVLQDVYTILLTSQGYRVHTANNGLEGLQHMKALHPDLVLLDLYMPVMDGKEFMRNIDVKDFPSTKIIVCTNLSDTNTESEMLALGAHKFLLKSSMSPQDMLLLVARTLQS